MRKLAAIIVALALPFVPSVAHADVALGTNFGAGVDFREGRSGRFFIGLPYGFELPGFRFTAATDNARHEFYFDSSLLHSGPYTIDPNQHVDSFTQFMLFIAYQHMFDPHSSNSFFFNAGGGPVVYAGGPDTTTLMIGGGVGFQQRIAGGHGTFREELRLDFVPARRDRLPQAVILGFKFGFDLWFR